MRRTWPCDSAKSILSPDATDAQKIEWLLQHADATEERIHDLSTRLSNEAQERHREIAQARDETEERMRNEIQNALDRHKRLRQFGIALSLIGLVLLDWGNFA